MQPKTLKFGKKIHFWEEIGSTNEEAIRRAKEGGEEGEVFLAESQSQGRGRQGRSWESPPGKNLYLSFLLRPTARPVEALPITLVAAAALHQSLIPFLPSPDTLKIKWPNDLYLGDKKMAGILTEMGSTADQIHWVVCGIGVNLNADREDFSPPVRKTATSLKIVTGNPVDRVAVTVSLIESFERFYFQFLEKGAAAAIDLCKKQSYLRGRQVGTAGPEGEIDVIGD